MLTRKQIRLNNYNYSQGGGYFVTICTKHKVNYFGEIRNDEMILNNAGKIANDNWKSIPIHFANAELDVFVVMPNHVHGILNIIEPDSVGDAYMRPAENNNRQTRTK